MSLTQAQVLELINNPPTAGHDGADERFRGRDWRTISIGDLVQEAELRWVEFDEGIEQATDVSLITYSELSRSTSIFRKISKTLSH